MYQTIIFTVLGVMVGVAVGYFYNDISHDFQDINQTNKITLSPSNYFINTSTSPYSNQSQCSFKLSAVNMFDAGMFTSKVSKQEEALVLSFIDLNTETPRMIGNFGDSVNLTKIDLGDTVYLIEQTSMGYIALFTLFRDKNVAIISKQYDLLGTPFGQSMIGECQSGSSL